MIIQPMLPLWLLIAITVLMLGLCIWQLSVLPGARARLNWSLRALMVIALAAVLIRPGVGSAEQQQATTDLDVFFAVDTTTSMIAQDWNGKQPRMDGVRADIDALMLEHPGARFSLITFDVSAVVRLPLTSDTSAVNTAMQVLTPEITIFSQGSDISVARELVVDVLKRTAEASPERSRVLYYFGDGEQTSSTAPGSFTKSAPYLSGGLVLGYGTEAGGQMYEQNGYYNSDREPEWVMDYSNGSGKPALSRIDEASLITIAGQLGLDYQHRSATDDVRPATVDAAAGLVTVNDQTVTVAFELYWIAALLLLLLVIRELLLLTRAGVEVRRALRETP